MTKRTHDTHRSEFCCYILQSDHWPTPYTGKTCNPARRLHRHNHPSKRSRAYTKGKGPWPGHDANALEDVHVQDRCINTNWKLIQCVIYLGLFWCVSRASSPPQIRVATDSDSIEDSALNSAEAGGTGAVSGMFLERKFEPHTLTIGAQPKHHCSDPPLAFAFCVRSRTLAEVVVAMQPPCEIARLPRVGRRPVV